MERELIHIAQFSKWVSEIAVQEEIGLKRGAEMDCVK